MKILFVIPHYYNPEGGGRHGSTRCNSAPRIEALNLCIGSLHQLFGNKQFFLDISKKSASPAHEFQRNEIDVVVLTVQDKHLLGKSSINPELYTQRKVKTEPMMLGFEAKKVFAENAGKYDYYCYLEDDLIITDAWFFKKLKWFNNITCDQLLLQPNRYEVSLTGAANKAYVDGDIKIRATEKFQDIDDSPTLSGTIMEEQVLFNRTLNPHSGCYFLNQTQLNMWMKESWFNENDIDFIGPLESAATLGIMKTFKVYKSEPQNFIEIMHFGSSFLDLIGNQFHIT